MGTGNEDWEEVFVEGFGESLLGTRLNTTTTAVADDNRSTSAVGTPLLDSSDTISSTLEIQNGETEQQEAAIVSIQGGTEAPKHGQPASCEYEPLTRPAEEFHECASQATKNLTFVLVGKSGNGKSATGNMLLGREAFKAKSSPGSVTKECQKESTVLDSGVTLSVIDTPGLFDTSATEEEVQAEIIECSQLAPDGIHGMLVVLSVNSRFTAEEAEAVNRLKRMFGPRLLEFAVLVFTHGDTLVDDDESDEEGVEEAGPEVLLPGVQVQPLEPHMRKAGQALSEYLSGAPKTLQEVLLDVHSRMLLFDNTVVKKKSRNEAKRAAQVGALLHLINELIAQHGGQIYSEILVAEMARAEELETQRLLAQHQAAAEEAEAQQQEYARRVQQQVRVEEGGGPACDAELQRDLRGMEARIGDRVEARVKSLEQEMQEKWEAEKETLKREVERAQQQAEEAQQRVERMREALKAVQEDAEKRKWWKQVPGCAIM